MTMLMKCCLTIVGLTVACGAVLAFGAQRDCYNDPLPPQAVARMGTVRFRHPGMCQTLSYALDGTVLISTGLGSARVWDAETGQERTVLGNVENPVHATGVIGNGNLLMVHGHRRTTPESGLVDRGYVWDLAGRREVRQLQVRAHGKDGAWRGPHLIAPTGAAMAEVRQDGDVWLWDGTGKPTHLLARAATASDRWYPLPAVFTADGKAVVTCDAAHLVQVWDVVTGKRLRSFGGGLQQPDQMALSPDGKLVATLTQVKNEYVAAGGAAMPDKVRVWEVASGKLVREIDWGEETYVYHRLQLTFRADSKAVIVVDERVGTDAEVRQWSLRDGKLLRTWKIAGRNFAATALAVHPKRHTLAVGTAHGVIRLFDLDTGKEKTPTELHVARLTTLAFSPEGRELHTIADDGTIRSWNAATGAPLHAWRYEGRFAELTRDGTAVLDVRYPGKTGQQIVSIRAPRTGQLEGSLLGLYGFVQAPDGKTLWAFMGAGDWPRRGDSLEQIGVSEVLARRPATKITGTPLGVVENGQLIVTHEGEQFFGWEVGTGRKRFEWFAPERKPVHPPGQLVPLNLRPYTTALAADGRSLALIVHRDAPLGMGPDERANAYLCELATGKVLWKVKSAEEITTSVAFRADGKVLAVGGLTVTLYDVATGTVLANLDGHRGHTLALASSPDGRRLASGAADGTALVWDVGNLGR